MSVSFHKMTSELVFLGGRAEAWWMTSHLPHDDIGDGNTKFYIDEDNIRAAVKSAREYDKNKELPDEFAQYQGTTPKDVMLKEHRRITRELPGELREMLAQTPRDKQAPRLRTYFEIEVCW